jgi:hypothetical protein
LGDLVLEGGLLVGHFTGELGLDDGEGNLEAVFAEVGSLDDLLIAGLFEEVVVVELFLLVIEDVDRVLVGSEGCEFEGGLRVVCLDHVE